MAYIGNNLDSDIQVNKYEYTATAGQTTFACTYDRAVDVYVNGVKLDSSDFTATTGTSIVLASGANAGDIVDINAYFDVTYANIDQMLPAQTGQTGKFLTTDGTNSSWDEVAQYTLPAQTGQTGKFLTTDGTNESWGTVDLTDLNPSELTIPTYATDPSGASTGDLYYNSTDAILKVYNGTSWVAIYTPPIDIEVLLVGGGGGGGKDAYQDRAAGGGGAGGYLTYAGYLDSGASKSITIGAGGIGGSGTLGAAVAGYKGTDTVAFGLTALAGGAGPGHDIGAVYAANPTPNGGSGGGSPQNGIWAPGTGTTGQGNRGGYGNLGETGGGTGKQWLDGNYYAGGGGGAGAPSWIPGGGGGAGSAARTGDYNGGAGGGGNGGYSTGPTGGGAGAPYSGGGGGAGREVNGGNGGSGVVIIRYQSNSQKATGGTVTTSGGYYYHTFTSSGTFTVN